MPLEGMMGRLYKLICIASSIALLRRTETDAYKAVIAMVAIVIFIFTVTTIVNIVVVLSFCNRVDIHVHREMAEYFAENDP